MLINSSLFSHSKIWDFEYSCLTKKKCNYFLFALHDFWKVSFSNSLTVMELFQKQRGDRDVQIGVCFTKKIKFEWLLKEHFDYAAKGRKGSKNDRTVLFSEIIFNWLINRVSLLSAGSFSWGVFFFPCSISVDFIVLWKMLSKSWSISSYKGNTLQTLTIFQLYCDFFCVFFPWKHGASLMQFDSPVQLCERR